MKAIWMETKHRMAAALPEARTALRRVSGARALGAALVVALAGGLSAPASAQQRVIKLVVPYGTGATLDIVARSFNAELGRALDASVIVENRAGAGGTVGTTLVAKATDNNTLLLTAASHNLAQYLYRNPGYDPIKDFASVSYVGNSGFVLAVPGDLGVNTVQEFIKLVKSKPGDLNYSSAGNAGNTHLAMASLLSKTGGQMQHIPMKSTGEAINEVLAGRVQGTIAATAAIIGQASNPRIKLLAYTGAKRSTLLPSLPTMAEAGVPDYRYDTWFAVLAPARMPKAEVEKIHTAMDKVLADPAVRDRLTRLGMEMEKMSLPELDKLLRDDLKLSGELVKASGARVE